MGLFSFKKKIEKEVDETKYFYNDDLREFEELNTTTKNIYELGKYDVLVILENGKNITKHDFLKYGHEIKYISIDLSKYPYLSSLNSINSKNTIIKNKIKVEAIVALNLPADEEDVSNLFESNFNLKTISGLDTWNTDNITNMNRLFARCEKLETINGLESWNFETLPGKDIFKECKLSMNDFPKFIKNLGGPDEISYTVINSNDKKNTIQLKRNEIGEYIYHPESVKEVFEYCFGGDILTIRYGGVIVDYNILDDTDTLRQLKNSVKIENTAFRKLVTKIENNDFYNVTALGPGGSQLDISSFIEQVMSYGFTFDNTLLLMEKGKRIKFDDYVKKLAKETNICNDLGFRITNSLVIIGNKNFILSTKLTIVIKEIEFVCRKVNQIPLSENITIFREKT